MIKMSYFKSVAFFLQVYAVKKKIKYDIILCKKDLLG